MTTVQNLPYYIGLWDKYSQLTANSQERRVKQSWFSPELRITRPLSTFLTDNVFYPNLRTSYALLAKLAVRVTKYARPELSKRIETSWDDPFDTATLTSIGKRVQLMSLYFAKQTPTKTPVLLYLHRASIVAARNLYILSKDMTGLLELPGKLHSYFTGYIDESVAPLPPPVVEKIDLPAPPPKTLLSRIWVWIREKIEYLKKAFLNLISKVEKAAEKPLARVPIVKSLFQELKEDVGKATESIRVTLLGKTHELIAGGETLARKKVIAKVGEAVSKRALFEGTHSCVKMIASYVTYRLAREVFVNYTQAHELTAQAEYITSKALTVIGLYLWVRYMTPTVQALHKDYREEFNPDASTLSEIRSIFRVNTLWKTAKFLRAKLPL